MTAPFIDPRPPVQASTITIEAASNPNPRARFGLQSPYLEHVWSAVAGPTSILLLRRCALLWAEAHPADIDTTDLATSLGLGAGATRVRHTAKRLHEFRLATWHPTDDRLTVFLTVPPLTATQLGRVGGWTRAMHDQLLQGRDL